jgi:hypothetical protein
MFSYQAEETAVSKVCKLVIIFPSHVASNGYVSRAMGMFIALGC